MTEAARKFLDAALLLSDDERANLASELLASLDGEPDADWESGWLAELDRRVEVAKQRGETGSDWQTARARILAELAREADSIPSRSRD